MERVRIVSLKGLSGRSQAIIREGQMEAARVWTLCRDMHLAARQEHGKWPNRDALQKATKGRFALHSQSVQMVAHAFLANVDTAQQLRSQGRTEIRYPYKDKTFYSHPEKLSIDQFLTVLMVLDARMEIRTGNSAVADTGNDEVEPW